MLDFVPIWTLLLGLAVFFYVLLDGFDLGVGMLYRFMPDAKMNIRDAPVAYLVDGHETNLDATNYWVFSEAGLRRLLARTHWGICRFLTMGDTEGSDPASGERIAPQREGVQGDAYAFGQILLDGAASITNEGDSSQPQAG